MAREGGPSLEAQLMIVVVVVASMRCKVIRGWREVKGEATSQKTNV
jgi:hypothetical protein